MGGKVYKIPDKSRSCVLYILNSALVKLKIPGNWTFSGEQIPMWVLFRIFEIAFFWKYFMCTFIRRVIYLVFLRSSYLLTWKKKEHLKYILRFHNAPEKYEHLIEITQIEASRHENGCWDVNIFLSTSLRTMKFGVCGYLRLLIPRV